MRLRIALILGLVTALAVGAVSLTRASNVSMANGGGQIVDEEQVSGAGDTIAFTVRDETAPTGQIQYVNRTDDGTGKGQIVLHGTPTCFRAEGNLAQIGVKWRDNTTGTIFVEDLGPSDDYVSVVPGSTPDCDDDEPDDETYLARGNVTVWDNQP